MKTKTRPWRHIYHDIEIPRPKSHNIEKRRQLTHDIVIPSHFFRGQKATTSRFQGWKTTTSRFQDQKATTSSSCGILTLMRPDKIKSSIKIWQLNFLSKKIDSCERSLFVLNYLKTFKAVRKNNQRTHSPQHNKKSCVDDSYLFLGLYSRKVAGRVIALGLPSFTKRDVSTLKQRKLTAPLNSPYSNWFKYQFSA